ncbi:HAD family hydrolase [Microbacterium oleivorans]|uniref:Putative phosphatase/phosphohexomutase n=1 Tax=Microbacterium oleivorans TaxID=273677 RepID=A0A031FZ80_9MICO|nr:HAD family phosphatase [Microbacterium oleivorans]EZP29562.1 putative phosphatase/phosphohexomutase [Microbacterium oleivorans]THE08882.1 HAD family phosphatase [Microbacterium oleivorans]
MISPLPAAVLWDMDGTLVDTEPYWMAAETPLVERFGGTWTHEDGLGMVGLGLEDAARILQGAGVRMEVDEIVAHLTAEVMRQLREDGVPFRPGAREMLRELRDAGVPTALVTMSMSRMAKIVTELIDFDAFDIVIGGDDVARPKPHPDPYLQACESLGVDPADTVAFEDSITGARSAIAAGTVTVGIPNMVSLDEVGAHVLWPTLEGRTVADVADVLAQARQGVRA